MSDFPPCLRRSDLHLVDREGEKTPISRCAHSGCDKFAKDVTPADCAGCILRVAGRLPVPAYILHDSTRDFQQPTLLEDGSIAYPKTGWEPPKCPDGYKPKSTDPKSADAWVFTPLSPPCADRHQYNGTLPCGCIKVTQVCVSRDSGHFGKAVDPEVCQTCPVRRAVGT